MAVKHILLLVAAALAFVASVGAACNNLQLAAEAPCCQGALVGNTCGTSTGLRGKCISVTTSNWQSRYTKDTLMCKLNTCKVNADCLDANYCTTDTCSSGKCVHTKISKCTPCKTGYNPGVCNDGNTCTKDSCTNVSLGWLSKCTHGAAAAGCVPELVPKYGQCGGLLYTGSTRCVSGTTCQKQYSYTQADPNKLVLNPYYSQCL